MNGRQEGYGMWLLRVSLTLGAVSLCCSCSGYGAPAVSGEPRVDALLARMTLAEKIALIHGVPEDEVTDQGQAGYLPGIPRLAIPALRFADGPPGVLTRQPATGLTATMGLAATFSRDDARQNGVVIGRDARALGIDVVLQPYINMHRDQAFSRAYNTYGEDPLLTGQIGAALITGIQSQQVMAEAKHYIAYDGAHDVTVDPQALHEIYLAPFAEAVAAGVASIMCSYNRVNDAYACGNAPLLTGVLRGELGFRGFVTSDWGAVHDTAFADAGLDLEMPGSGTVMNSYFEAALPPPGTPRRILQGPSVNEIPEEPRVVVSNPPDISAAPVGMLAAIQSGTVREQSVTRAAAHILYEMNRFGLLDGADRHRISAQAAEANAAIVRKTAQDAAVLLKNDAGLLPLAGGDLASLAMIGPGAAQTVAIGNSGEKALGHVERQVGAVAALRAEAGGSAHIEYAVADDMTGTPVPARNFLHGNQPGLARTEAPGGGARVDPQLNFTRANGNPLPPGARASWSGSLVVPHAGRYRLYLQVLGAAATIELDARPLGATGPLELHGDVLQPGQDSVLPTTDGLDNVRRDIQLTAGVHALRVSVTGDASDQPVQARLSWVTPQQQRADYAAALNAARHARRAVVFAWSRGRPSFGLPGDQDRLIQDVAAVNPNTIVVLNISEPVAMPWLAAVKAVLLMWYPGDEGGGATADVLQGRVNPAGRLPFTWPRSLDQNVANDASHPERSSSGIADRTRYSEGIFIGYRWFDQQRIEPLYPFGYGMSYTHFEYSGLAIGSAVDGGLDVGFLVRNTGAVSGDEVAQVYLGPPAPAAPAAQFAVRTLAAFARVGVAAGDSRRVTLHLPLRALQYWSVNANKWVTAAGSRTIFVGASSRDLRLQGTATPTRFVGLQPGY